LILNTQGHRSLLHPSWLKEHEEFGTYSKASSTRHQKVKKVKVKADIALHGNTISELCDITCHKESHSVTCQPTQVNAPRLTPAMQAGTRFTYAGGMEG